TGRNGTRINVHRNRRQTGRKAHLPRVRRVGSQSVETVNQIARHLVRPHLRVIHAVTAANGGARAAAGMPAKSYARLKAIFLIGQSLPVITQSQIEHEIRSHSNAVLYESG